MMHGIIIGNGILGALNAYQILKKSSYNQAHYVPQSHPGSATLTIIAWRI